MYIKKIYANDPLFEDVKVIYSIFDNSFDGVLSNTLPEKLLFENLEASDVTSLKASNITNLHKFAIDHSDAVVQASADMDKKILEYIKSSEKPFMEYPGAEDYINAYQDFYEQFIEEEQEIALIEN